MAYPLTNYLGNHFISLLLVVGLTGCGGGGGGSSGGSGGVATTAQPPLAITSANAETTSGEVAESGSNTIGVGSVGGGVFTGAVLSAADRPGLSEIGRWAVDKLIAERGRLTPSLSAVVYTDTLACTGGGSIGITWNDADNDSDFSTGDTFTMTFNNCLEDGIRYGSGTMSMTGLSLTGDPMVVAAWSLGVTLGFTDVQFSIGVESVRINGDMSLSMQTSDGVNVTTVVAGTTLSTRENSQTNTLRNFNFTYTENLSTLAFSLTYSGTVDIGRVSGRVSFATTTPFTGNDVLLNWPTSGELVITGANSSTVTLLAQGGDNVRLDLDTNGDAVTDQSISTTWTALAAL